ncbi:MAG: hypothetical protein RBJ76_21575 [Stenomitos frigidus ULC029]
MRHFLLQFTSRIRLQFPSGLRWLKQFSFAIVLGMLLTAGGLLPSRVLAQPSAFISDNKITLAGQHFLASQSIAHATKQTSAIVVNRLRQNLSQRTQKPLATLKLIKTESKTWSDGCLGLAAPKEICTEALVEGWRVVFSDGNQRWAYRLDQQGQDMRLER